MYAVLAILLALPGNGRESPRDQFDAEVDVVEYNTVYSVYQDEAQIGRPWIIKVRLKQIIGWKLDRDGTWHADWWLMGHDHPCEYYDGYRIILARQSTNVVYRVKAKHVTYTHTTYDPEVEDRSYYPMDWRGGFRKWQLVREFLRTALKWNSLSLRRPGMDLNRDFYDPVKRKADTETQKVPADVVSRVLRCASDYLHSLPACKALELLSAWLNETHDRDNIVGGK